MAEPTEEEAPPVGENEDIIFTDGSTGAADITASAETADAGQQEETEETEEETDAISDIDVHLNNVQLWRMETGYL